MTHVFISYKREDKAFALELKQQLRDAQFEVWIDENVPPGQKWREEIDDQLRKSFAIVLVVTPESMQSEYVTYEWIFALGANVEVIPVYLKSVNRFPYRLEDFQYIDFRTNLSWGQLFRRLQEIQRRGDIPPTVRGAIEALDSHDPDERKAAIESLAQINHPSAIEALISAIQHNIRDVRVYSAFKLAELGNVRCLPGLNEALTANGWNVYQIRGWHVRLEAVERYMYLDGDYDISKLIEVFENDDVVDIRLKASQVLGNLKNSAAMTALLTALEDNFDTIRIAATIALAEIEDDKSVLGLLNALHDRNEQVRVHAAIGLARIGDTAAISGLLDILSNASWDERIYLIGMLERGAGQKGREVIQKWKQTQGEKADYNQEDG